MASVLIAALFALTSLPAVDAVGSEPANLDRSCFRLMAELSANEDPTIRSAGLVGAQYFLGRIDAAHGDGYGFDPAADTTTLPAAAGEREALVRQCGAMMGAGGRDFRAIGERLARRGPSV